jgi:hypothetical protein
MRITTVVLAVALSGLAGQAALAQTKPNFSGRWVQVTPAGEAEGGGSEQVVTQDATTLTTEHPSEGGSHRQTYKLGGESRSTVGPVEVVATTVWDGAKLVLTSTATYPGNNKRESKQVWSLGADGKLTIELSAKNPDGTTTEIKSVHQKK